MTKTICDICGNDMPLEKYSRSTKDYNFCISSNGKIWDICTECRNELGEWMKKRKTESEPQTGSNECMFSDYPDMPYQYDNMTGSMNL